LPEAKPAEQKQTGSTGSTQSTPSLLTKIDAGLIGGSSWGNAEGHNDGANTGNISEMDKKVGFGIVGVMSGGAILLAGGSTITLVGAGLGFLNSADNVNFSEESISQTLTTNPNIKRNIGYTKFGISCMSLGTSFSNPSQILQDPFTSFSTAGDAYSISTFMYNEGLRFRK